ncbi:MAG TPA: hypothetical protein VHL53_00380 [Acidimicrobiia bacterium]|nr:hypothetical protein [Acidimicrobiia bacterium]
MGDAPTVDTVDVPAEAVDLLAVAGTPVVKRVVPVALGAVAAAVVLIGVGRQRSQGAA